MCLMIDLGSHADILSAHCGSSQQLCLEVQRCVLGSSKGSFRSCCCDPCMDDGAGIPFSNLCLLQLLLACASALGIDQMVCDITVCWAIADIVCCACRTRLIKGKYWRLKSEERLFCSVLGLNGSCERCACHLFGRPTVAALAARHHMVTAARPHCATAPMLFS